MDIFETANADDLAQSVAAEITRQLQRAIADRRRASLVVSGGKSPILLFRHLRRAQLDWSKVTVALADERWVPLSHPESNESSIRRHLLVERASAARFESLRTDDHHPADAVTTVEKRITSIHRPFDVVLLGMGMDGHTASWFPDAQAIPDCISSQRLCYAIESPAAQLPRMTLTPAAILDSRRILLLFATEHKRRVFSQACLPGPLEDLPVRVILQQNTVPVGVRFSTQEAPNVRVAPAGRS